MRQVQLALLVITVASSAVSAAAQGAQTRRVTVDSNGAQANGYSDFGALARGGNFVVFNSAANNLVPGDTNNKSDVFVHDLSTGVTTRESVDSNGVLGNSWSASTNVGISADGRFVVFGSLSTELVPGDVNGQDDIFLRDRLLGTTTLSSLGSAGQQGAWESVDPSVSNDGRYVSFTSRSPNFVSPDTNGTNRDIFVRDLVAGTTVLASIGPQGSQSSFGAFDSVISGDGRFVAFRSESPNMVPVGAYYKQIFVRDLVLGTTAIESISTAGVPANAASSGAFLSTDGRYMTFFSAATNLVLSGLPGGFLRDRVTGTTELVTKGYGGVDTNIACGIDSVSDDGRFILFSGYATNVLPHYGYPTPGVQGWIRDTVGGDNVPVAMEWLNSQPVGALMTGMSADGQVAMFRAGANNVVPNDTNGAADFFVLTAPFEGSTYFCSSKVNSLGCAPLIIGYGHSSVNQTFGFQITASSVFNRRPGILLYCVNGRAALPFGGGTLCLSVVHRNTPALNAGGSLPPATDCSGSYSVDMNSFAAGLLGGPPLPVLSVPGTKVQCQFWSRDPGFAPPNAVGLTGALEYTVGS